MCGPVLVSLLLAPNPALTITTTTHTQNRFDFLTFLASTVAVVPVCKYLKVSPVIGFLATGLILQQLG